MFQCMISMGGGNSNHDLGGYRSVKINQNELRRNS